MKRIISLAVVALLIVSVLALAACGSDNTDLSDSKYVGTWEATDVTLDEEAEALGDEWILTLNGDGTGQFKSDEETSDTTWSLTDEGFKTKGDVKLTFVDDGDNIKAKIMGVGLVFEKK